MTDNAAQRHTDHIICAEGMPEFRKWLALVVEEHGLPRFCGEVPYCGNREEMAPFCRTMVFMKPLIRIQGTSVSSFWPGFTFEDLLQICESYVDRQWEIFMRRTPGSPEIGHRIKATNATVCPDRVGALAEQIGVDPSCIDLMVSPSLIFVPTLADLAPPIDPENDRASNEIYMRTSLAPGDEDADL